MKQAACVLVEKNGKVLAVSRKNNKTVFGLPGGKCDENETHEQAAIRELKEETGLTLSNPIECFERMPDLNDVYTCKTFIGQISGKIYSEEDGVVDWVDWETLWNGPFGGYNRALFNHINNIQ